MIQGSGCVQFLRDEGCSEVAAALHRVTQFESVENGARTLVASTDVCLCACHVFLWRGQWGMVVHVHALQTLQKSRNVCKSGFYATLALSSCWRVWMRKLPGRNCWEVLEGFGTEAKVKTCPPTLHPLDILSPHIGPSFSL